MIYAAYYLDSKTGETAPIYYEGLKGWKPGDIIEQWNGDRITIEFEVNGDD